MDFVLHIILPCRNTEA